MSPCFVEALDQRASENFKNEYRGEVLSQTSCMRFKNEYVDLSNAKNPSSEIKSRLRALYIILGRCLDSAFLQDVGGSSGKVIQEFVEAEAPLAKVNSGSEIIKKDEELIDLSRKRQIPIQILYRESNSKNHVVLLNHGYGVTYKEYQFIANHLAKLGFFVVSIQHDLKTDPKLPREGNIFERRKPLWQRGVQNILFVLDELKRIDPNLDLDKVTLIGHSNGGDIAMMFADLYPQKTAKVISIDSLRYPFPVKHSLPILTLRATDTKPDEGVLPLKDAKIVTIKNAKHNEMYDAATDGVQSDIMNEISNFLK